MNPALDPQSQFVATLKLTSDWHIGLGAGRPGEIDRLIQRDTEGLPFVPAKTLTGIWRDACEAVAYGLDNGRVGAWSAWVTYLFGEQPAIATPAQVQTQAYPPRPAALSIRAASFSDSFKQAIASNQPLLTAMTFVKPGIAIDAKNGCAKENFLRFEEMARTGATLQANCELLLDGLEPAQQKTAYCLLLVSTQLMTRLGGKRRRGAGGCKLSMEGDVAAWLAWLKDNAEPPNLPPTETALNEVSEGNKPQWKPTENSGQPDQQQIEWTTVPLQLTAQSPLVIACRTLGNVVETLDYIPGSHLLRLVMQRLRPLGVNLGQAIAHKELIITNATLEIQNKRGFPVPLALSGTKRGGGLEKGGTLYNRLAEEIPKQTQLKGERGGYLVPGSLTHLPPFGKVGKAVLTHNTIEDAVQRPTQAVGGVYSYQAIVPGTTFRAELRLPTALAQQIGENQNNWWQNLTGDARIGQSKKDSYGQVTLTAFEPETATSATKIANVENHQLTVWLLSDLLLRDQRLRPSTSITVLAKALGDRLGCVLTPREQPSVLSVIARSHRVESWQVRWGLPRPSLTGLAAGSCFVFDIADNQQIAPEKLQELAIQGLGNRCAEGFGQVSFNAPLLIQSLSALTANAERFEQASASSLASGANEANLLTAPSGGAPPEITYARCIEKAAWRDAIQKAAESLAADADKRQSCVGFSGNQPGMSQLGSLRSLLARLKEPNQPSTATWIDRVSDKRAEKWPLGSLDKLDTLFKDGNDIWRVLAEGLTLAALPPLQNLRLVRGDETWLKNELWAEAVQILIATCIRAHKRAMEENSNLDNNNANNSGGSTHGTAA